MKDKEEGLQFNGKYHKDQQQFLYCMLLRRLFWRRTRKNDFYCKVLYNNVLNIYIYIYLFIYLFIFSGVKAAGASG